MRIAILTSGILPIPAVKGGAVENLIDFYLEYNEIHRLHDITVYSIADEDTNTHPALKSNVNHYYYIDTKSIISRIRKYISHLIHKKDEYYHYTIEFYLNEAVKDIRSKNYDIIVTENRPAYALRLKEITSSPIIYHLHNEHLTNKTKRYQEIYDAATRIITVSDYIKSRVKTINPTDNKCITVHNGINLDVFSAKNNTCLRAEMGFKESDFIMVFSGRVTPEKGICQLIEAMLMLKDIEEIKLMVIGNSFYGNTENEDDFSNTLRQKAEPLRNKIHFTGYIPYHDIPQYLRICDIAVLPSMWEEPFGLTIVEAMAAGLPLITTRSGGIPEICERVAIITNKDNIVNNLTEAIRDLYNHPEKRQAMSKVALERSKFFNKERYSADFFKALEIP